MLYVFSGSKSDTVKPSTTFVCPFITIFTRRYYLSIIDWLTTVIQRAWSSKSPKQREQEIAKLMGFTVKLFGDVSELGHLKQRKEKQMILLTVHLSGANTWQWTFLSVRRHCWLSDRKDIRPVKSWVLMTIWLELCTSYISNCRHHFIILSSNETG